MRPKQLKKMIRLAISSDTNLIIKGRPGVGKTEICKQVIEEVCAEIGGDYLVTHPVMKDPTEYSGLGFPSADRTHAEFLPYGDMVKMTTAEKLLVVLVDDLGQASESTQTALMQVMWGRNVNGKPISEHVRFIACTNERTDKAGVRYVLEPLKGRNCIVGLEVNDDDWREWANGHGMPPELIAFSKLRPQLLFEFKPTTDMTNSNSPRNWARAGQLQVNGLPEEIEFEVFEGCAGEKFAAEYTAFLKAFRDMPEPGEWIKNPNKPMPEKENVRYALAAAVAHMANRKNLDNVFKLAMNMDAEYSTFMVFSMIAKDKSLAESSGMVVWAKKYADYLM